MTDRAARIGRARLIWLPILGVAVGVGAGWLTLSLGLGDTPRELAVAETQALVPAGADPAPVGELDPPFWYGAIYTITQRFSGGADDRALLAETMLSHLASRGWEVSDIQEDPGATLVYASMRDLVSVSHLRGPPSTARVEGVIQVRHRARNEMLTLLVGGLAGGAAGLALAVLMRFSSDPHR